MDAEPDPPSIMKQLFSLLPGLALALCTTAQTYFHIDQIVVSPANPTTSDSVSIRLIGDLSDTGAFIEVVLAEVAGDMVNITLMAYSDGGATVLVPHTETLELGRLHAGTYTIDFTDATTGVLDQTPLEQHGFTVTGAPCEDLELRSIHWHPFTDTILMVHVRNNGPTLFNHPNFILYDAQGDTLAKETVDLFGIGPESWHPMRVMDGATIPEPPFAGTLELWTLLTTEHACTWEMEFALCPPGPCVPMVPFVQNVDGGTTIGTFDWAIYGNGDEVANGRFELTNATQADTDTICLPPGRYDMNVVPHQPLSGGRPMYGAYAHGPHSSATQEVYGQLPVLLPIEFHMPCADITTGLIDHGPSGLVATPAPGGMMVHRQDGAPPGALWLFDAQGRLVFSSTADTDRTFVPMPTPGIYLLRTANATLKVLGGVQ